MYIRFIFPIQINEQTFVLTHFRVHLFNSFAERCRDLFLNTEEIKCKTEIKNVFLITFFTLKSAYSLPIHVLVILHSTTAYIVIL